MKDVKKFQKKVRKLVKQYNAQGSLSPTVTSSSQHTEKSDNYVEYYAKSSAQVPDTGNNISVTTTQDHSYNAGGQESTTEPDPQSQLAMQKGSSCCEDCQGDSCDGNCCDKCMGMTKAACSCCDSCGSDCNGDCCDNCSVEKSADLDLDIEKKEFSNSRRKKLAQQGKAMGDGSYPIEDEKDLKNAIRSWGRGGAKPEVKQHIIRRAKALGKQDLIPDDWKSDMKKSLWGSAFLPLD
jgi:hypothetical protein